MPQKSRRCPKIISSGRKGVVTWIEYDSEQGTGPAWLERGDDSDRLFRGWLVTRRQAEDYAAANDHDFEAGDSTDAPVPFAKSPQKGRQLTRPYRTVIPGEEPEPVEDGTKGVVQFKGELAGVGSAKLVRGERVEPLFRGKWVAESTARNYATRHGHAFVQSM